MRHNFTCDNQPKANIYCFIDCHKQYISKCVPCKCCPSHRRKSEGTFLLADSWTWILGCGISCSFISVLLPIWLVWSACADRAEVEEITKGFVESNIVHDGTSCPSIQLLLPVDVQVNDGKVSFPGWGSLLRCKSRSVYRLVGLAAKHPQGERQIWVQYPIWLWIFSQLQSYQLFNIW